MVVLVKQKSPTVSVPATEKTEPTGFSEKGRIATLCGRIGDRLLVEHETLGTFEAQTTVEMDASTLASAVRDRRKVTVMFFDGVAVVTGLLQPLPQGTPETARINHQPVTLNYPEGLILKSGRASIRLLPDGRILLRGKEIVSRARQRNRLIGGALRFN